MHKNSAEFIVDRLNLPKDYPVDIVLDTDAYNEIDDQFAIAYVLASSDCFNIKGIFAAPFHNLKSNDPADGMEKSYNEVLKLLNLSGFGYLKDMVHRGSIQYLSSETEKVDSPAAHKLVELALAQPDERPLYVVAIAALTNVASAILMRPDIIRKIVVVWLGGHSVEWPVTDEFNMRQDVMAARVVLGSTVPVVMFPCGGVVTHLTTTEPELRHWLEGKNSLCDYLVNNTVGEATVYAKGSPWSRVIWDVAPVAWLINPAFVPSRVQPALLPSYDNHYTIDPTRHPIRYAYHVKRDAVFGDMFARLARLKGKETMVYEQ